MSSSGTRSKFITSQRLDAALETASGSSSSEARFLSVSTHISGTAQSAADYLQTALLNHLRSNLGCNVYARQHDPVMIIPVRMIKNYLDVNTKTEVAKAAKSNRVEVFMCLSLLSYCLHTVSAPKPVS